jgi:hypothetical protein
MKVTQHLWFEKDMEAAIGCYTSLIPGSAIAWTTTIPAETLHPAGSVKIASFTLGDQRHGVRQVLDPSTTASHHGRCDTQAEIDRLWDALRKVAPRTRLVAGSLGLSRSHPRGRRVNDGSTAPQSAYRSAAMVNSDIAARGGAARGYLRLTPRPSRGGCQRMNLVQGRVRSIPSSSFWAPALSEC